MEIIKPNTEYSIKIQLEQANYTQLKLTKSNVANDELDNDAVLENKTDYGKKILSNPSKAFTYKRSSDAYPIVHIKPIVSEPDVTIVAYGGMADYVSTMIEDLFKECDIKPELIIPSLISEIPVEFIAKQLSQTKKLIVIEEGSSYSSYSSELIAALSEVMNESFKVKRIAGLPVPIPSVKSLEDQVLPSKDRIINEIKSTFN